MSKGKLIAAAPEVCADILYAGGFSAPDEILYFETEKTKAVAVSILEFDRARNQVRKGVEVLPLEKFVKKGKRADACKALLNISRIYGIDEWIVPRDFPFLYGSFLMQNNIRVTVPETVFFPEREIKRKREIAALKKVMKVTQDTMELVRSFLQESKVGTDGLLRRKGRILTSEFIIAEAECFMKRCGCTSSGMIAASGSAASQPHNHGTGPVRAGEPLVVDIFPRSDLTGYWGDMTRTFVKGHPLPVVQRAWRAVLDASAAAEKMIRDGVRASDVHLCAAEVMEKAGFRTGRNRNGVPCGFIHGLGHGIGLEIHEAPRVSPFNKGLLKAGNVISNEPGLYDPDWGGIRLEDALLVTKDGSENFYTMDKELIIG